MNSYLYLFVTPDSQLLSHSPHFKAYWILTFIFSLSLTRNRYPIIPTLRHIEFLPVSSLYPWLAIVITFSPAGPFFPFTTCNVSLKSNKHLVSSLLMYQYTIIQSLMCAVLYVVKLVVAGTIIYKVLTWVALFSNSVSRVYLKHFQIMHTLCLILIMATWLTSIIGKQELIYVQRGSITQVRKNLDSFIK